MGDAEKALELRLKGWQYHRIANELGVPLDTVYAWCADQCRFPTTDVLQRTERAICAMQLDSAISVVDQILEEGTHDTQVKAVNALVSVINRKAKLLGLDSPDQVSTVVTTVDASESPRKAREAINELIGHVGPKEK